MRRCRSATYGMGFGLLLDSPPFAEEKILWVVWRISPAALVSVFLSVLDVQRLAKNLAPLNITKHLPWTVR